MKIAYIVSQFPSPTETFIQSQIIGMIEAGLEVNIFAGKQEMIFRFRKT